MKERIEKYQKKLDDIIDFIKSDLKEFMKDLNFNATTNAIQVLNLKEESDIFNAIYGRGFYIILTDKKFDDNKCEFEFEDKKAIYRGHSYFVKKRLLSHLANKKYQGQRKSSEPNYKVCLKIEELINGININEEPYNKWNWTIIILKMNNSSKLMREQAELAFDELYHRPIKSRE